VGDLADQTPRLGDRPDPGRSRRMRRTAIPLSPSDLVECEPLDPDRPFLLRVTPRVEGVDLAEWGTANREQIRSWLDSRGAIRLRGFGPPSIEQFERFLVAICGELISYTSRSTPRSQVQGKIYSSTEFPAHRQIPLHNEMSYAAHWPLRLGFHCVHAAQEGGETPLADSRKVLRRLSSSLRSRFTEKGVMYTRNYGSGIDLPWEEVFQTTSRQEVEAFSQSEGIQCEWLGTDRLRTRQVRPAAAVHPRTGEEVWFNQAHLFHATNVPEDGRQALHSLFSEEDLPRDSHYGDGSPIEAEALEEIREAYRLEQVAFSWQPGDIVLVDNMLVAHGRQPFRGERKIVVGMAESFPPASL
jgi:alpha-ketoglutarate-dependent taurine dioxygenase